MTPQEKALFESRTVLQAHANLLSHGIANGASTEAIFAQIAIVKDAADAFAKLPRPQQKAA